MKEQPEPSEVEDLRQARNSQLSSHAVAYLHMFVINILYEM